MTNDVLDCLKTRRSVRTYSDRPVEQEKLDAIMEAATYAPTGGGTQSPVIVVVKDPETVQKLSKLNAKVVNMGDRDPFYGAPVVAIVLADKKKGISWFEDACLVAGNLLNAAHSVGVDSCFIFRAHEMFDSIEGHELLKEWGLEGDYQGVANIILGYSDEPEPDAAPRKADYVHYVG